MFSTSKAEINYHPKTTSIYDYDKKNNDHIERNVNFFELPDVLNTFFNWSKQDVTPILNIYCKIKQNIHPLMVQNDWGRVKWLSYLTNCSENSLKKNNNYTFSEKRTFPARKKRDKKNQTIKIYPLSVFTFRAHFLLVVLLKHSTTFPLIPKPNTLPVIR